MALDQCVEIVTRVLRKQAPRELHGAQHRPAQRQLTALQRVAQKAVIETCVVSHECHAIEALVHFGRELFEGGLLGNHCVADTGQRLYRFGNGDAGVDQLLPALGHHAVTHTDDRDFGNAVMYRVATGGLDIDVSIGALQHAAPSGNCIHVQSLWQQRGRGAISGVDLGRRTVHACGDGAAATVQG